ncbi:MAG: hypothetical protein L3K09_05690 [Thermoplasmata archaeon]|nr:hypothetical protein [Thermoplasmata archaeon]
MASTAPSSVVATVREAATRRSWVFIFVPTLFLFLITGLSESDKWLHALDDAIIVAAMTATLLYFLVTRSVSSPTELARINRWGLIASVVVVAAGILAIALEYSDANDIGDDPLTVIAGVLSVVNGLLVMAAAGARTSEESQSYGVEWSRIRTGFFFSLAFLVIFFVSVLPPYPAYSPGQLLAGAKAAALLLTGVAGLYLLVRSRTVADPATLRRYNNVLLGLAVALAVLALLQGDIGTLPFAVVLVANRFL